MSKTVCWNAIVKNESKIIKRCMSALVKYIDYWVVIDTGSTDGTQDIIIQFMKENNVPGELVERPWVNFSHNRNEALEFAENKADYILLCDADMELVVRDKEWKNKIECSPIYSVIQKNKILRYYNTRLINGRLIEKDRIRYWGATHEYCDSISGNASKENFEYIEFLDHTDGGAKSDKFERDANLLQAELDFLFRLDTVDEHVKQYAIENGIWDRKNELIQRNTFYLAQTWRDSEKWELALETYKNRVFLGGWEEEVYYSLLQIALLKEKLEMPFDETVKAYLTAYEYRPHRAESLYELARYLRYKDRIKLAYIYAKVAESLPLSKDRLFVNYPVYEWKAKDELAVSSYWVGNYNLCHDLCVDILANNNITEETRNRVKENLYLAKLKLSL